MNLIPEWISNSNMPLHGKAMLGRALQDRDSGAVRRWHATRTNRVQSVAEHTWGCCMLLKLVAPDSRVQLYQALLTHDHAERATGDVPATAKTMWPALKQQLEVCEYEWHRKHGLVFELTEAEQTLLNFCDYFELMLWSYEELCMGNMYAQEPLYGITGVLDTMRDNLPERAGLVYDAARAMVMDSRGATHGFQIQPR